MRKIIFIAFCFMSCQEQQVKPLEKIKVGCYCNDGTYIVWNENIFRQTGWTTGNPCWDKGGINNFVYAN